MMARQAVEDVRLLQFGLSTWLRTRLRRRSGPRGQSPCAASRGYVAAKARYLSACSDAPFRHGLPGRMFSWHNADEAFRRDKGRDTDGRQPHS